MEEVKKIQSFTVDHDFITPGIYVSRIDKDITTYDLRTRIPNADSYMDHSTMHTTEHMLATYIRNSEIKEDVIYFGPMGCQTGFYLLIRNADNLKVLSVLKDCLKKVTEYEGEVFGSGVKECGNYRSLNLEKAKNECRAYLKALSEKEQTFRYEKML